MKVFVTGASGFIGSAVIRELLNAGHEIIALARSDASRSKLEKYGPKVKVFQGNLEDLDSLKQAAIESDGIIHLGFIHDWNNFEECCQIDRKATEAMCGVLEGTNRPFIYTSGTLILPKGKLAFEDDGRDPHFPSTRAITEQVALAYKDKGVRVMAIRPSPTVHGEGDMGFIPSLIKIAKEKGVSGYIGEGQNVWPAVHRLDIAILYRLALEKGAAGAAFHGASEQGVKTKDIALAIGKILNVPIVSIDFEKAQEHFGFLGLLFGLDNPTSSEKTRKELGWKPKNKGLIEEISTSRDHGKDPTSE